MDKHKTLEELEKEFDWLAHVAQSLPAALQGRISWLRKSVFDQIIQLETERDEPIDLAAKAIEISAAQGISPQEAVSVLRDTIQTVETERRVAGLESDLRFCMDTAHETPEIHKSNRVGKALSDIYNRCAAALSEPAEPIIIEGMEE